MTNHEIAEMNKWINFMYNSQFISLSKRKICVQKIGLREFISFFKYRPNINISIRNDRILCTICVNCIKNLT